MCGLPCVCLKPRTSLGTAQSNLLSSGCNFCLLLSWQEKALKRLFVGHYRNWPCCVFNWFEANMYRWNGRSSSNHSCSCCTFGARDVALQWTTLPKGIRGCKVISILLMSHPDHRVVIHIRLKYGCQNLKQLSSALPVWKADVLRFSGTEKCCVKVTEGLARLFEDSQFSHLLGTLPSKCAVPDTRHTNICQDWCR